MNIFIIFDNREISIGIWLIFFLIFILILFFKKKLITKFIPGLLKSIFNYKILIIFFSIFAYSFFIVYIFYIANLWNILLLKDTIIWTLFVGTSITINSIGNTNSPYLFKKIILDNIIKLLVIEFIINFYTFPLCVEIILIPLLTIVVIFDTFLQTTNNKNNKNSCFSNFLKTLQVLFSLAIISYFIYKLITDFNNFFTIQTAKEFLLPIVLTISFLPFIYIIALLTSYETIFLRLNVFLRNDKKIKSYAKKEIIKYCLLNLRRLTNILKYDIQELLQIRNKTDVDNFIGFLRSKIIIKFYEPN